MSEKATGTGIATLDPLGTNVDPLASPDVSDQALASAREHPHPQLHRGVMRDRVRIIASLLDDPDSGVRRRAWRMRDCRVCPVIYIDDSGQPRGMLASCQDRCCPTCAARKADRVRTRVESATESWRDMRMITLTLDHRGEALSDMVSRLVASYRRIRQTRLWRDRVTGAVATIEVTRSRESGDWHAHLHILADGDYIPRDQLVAAWDRATGGATIIWIERVRASRSAAGYVSKYVSKPADVSQWPASAIREWAAALRGRRLLITSGSAHGVPTPAVDPSPPPRRNGATVPWHRLAMAIRAGLPEALCLYSSCVESIAGLRGFIGECLPPGYNLPRIGENRTEICGSDCVEAINRWWAHTPIEARPPPVRPKRRIRREDTPPLLHPTRRPGVPDGPYACDWKPWYVA